MKGRGKKCTLRRRGGTRCASTPRVLRDWLLVKVAWATGTLLQQMDALEG